MPPKKTKNTSNATQNAATSKKGRQTNLPAVAKVTGSKSTSNQTSRPKPKPRGQPKNADEASNNNGLSAAETKLLKELQAKAKSNPLAALQAQQDESKLRRSNFACLIYIYSHPVVCKRNADMMAAEDDVDEGDVDEGDVDDEDANPTSTNKRKHPNVLNVVEEDLDGRLGHNSDDNGML